MRSQVLPLLDLWFAANAKAYVLTVAANAKRYCLLPYWVRAVPMYESSMSAGTALSNWGIVQAQLFMYNFLNLFYIPFLSIYLMYTTID